VAQPTLDRAALARDVALAWDRYRYLWAVLEGAREVTRTVVPRFEEVALLPLVEEVRTQLALRLGERGARLAFEVDVAPSLTLEVHRAGLLQALQNFAQNAVEAYPEEAARLEVRVAARKVRAGSQTEITVVDRGSGMTEAKCDSLFVPFGSRKPGGTGVGLLIARTMVEEVHGGTLTFESAIGVGTTVKVLLPSRQAGR
jgi:signal transduction histidine kinase